MNSIRSNRNPRARKPVRPVRKPASVARKPLADNFRWLLGHVEPIAPLVSTESDESNQDSSRVETESHALPIKSISTVIEENFSQPAVLPERKIKQQQETLRPIVSLAFVLPLVLLYEIGVILFRNDSNRSGIDYWLQEFLATFGGGQLVVLPLITSAILLVWHHRQDDQWQFKPATLMWMVVEAFGLGVILFLAADATSLIMLGKHPPPVIGILDLIRDPVWCSRAISCLGAGIYEELFFRILIFLPLCTWLAKKLEDETVALVTSMLLVSLMFAIVHYDIVNPAGEPFSTTTFLFRLAGSMILCALFKFRGFGIAVGVHVVFDVLMLT
jgi:hypothetical protein